MNSLASKRALRSRAHHMVRGALRVALARFVITSLALGAGACTPKPDVSCEGALKEWLAAMQASENDVRRLKDAYALLGPETRAKMEKRASSVSARLGRRIQPQELFTEGRVQQAFPPTRFTEKKEGQGGTLTITGEPKTGNLHPQAEVRCAYEDGRARIELEESL